VLDNRDAAQGRPRRQIYQSTDVWRNVQQRTQQATKHPFEVAQFDANHTEGMNVIRLRY
jgi:hypothetical protein